jgi:hypothetical protein
MRICPKCNAYYDDSSTFCVVEGQPLVKVDPGSSNWNEGSRRLQEKQTALRRSKRRLTWRRIVVTALTLSLVTVVVCVVAINGVIYLGPGPAPTPARTPLIGLQGGADAFLIHYRISGHFAKVGQPVAGVHVVIAGAKSGSVTTDAHGYYSFSELPAGGSYLVTPAGGNPNFTPASRPFAALARDETADFTTMVQPDVYRISGRVTGNLASNGGAVRGVTIKLSGAKTLSLSTDVNGRFTFSKLPAGSYTVTPSSATLKFTRSFKTFTNLRSDTAADFELVPAATYKISGQVTYNGRGLSGATVNLTGTRRASIKTDDGGFYVFKALPSGRYTVAVPAIVTPGRGTVNFSPRLFNNLSGDQTANFAARSNANENRAQRAVRYKRYVFKVSATLT